MPYAPLRSRMMRRCVRIVAAVCVASIASVSFGEPPAAHQRRDGRQRRDYRRPDLMVQADQADRQALSERAPVSLADGCVASPAFCNTVAFGRLAPGDCTATDGTFLDALRFSGAAGQYVIFTVRPQSTTYTAPLALLAPPVGDASKTPLISGGVGAATVSSVLTSTGSWTGAVGSSNLFSSGDYAARSFCEPDPDPSSPPGCVTQTLLCNQRASWYLTNQSCRFSGADSGFVYADFEIYGVPNDVLQIDLISDFAGGFGVIPFNGQTYLATSTFVSNSEQIANFLVPSVGFYEIIVTTQQPQTVGFFSLSVKCSSSGCIEPLVIQQPQDIKVPFGQHATIQASANGMTPHFDWYDATSGLPTLAANTATLQTIPVTAQRTYYFVASNACGTDTSALVRVTPLAPSRSRAVKH
jgi:hypothetical protein